MIWSAEQEKAIAHSTARDGSAIVSSAAGSGKTAMLVERITRLITNEESRIPADKIVAVTFTNDAAAELKTRLEAAINLIISDAEKIGSGGSPSPWLQEQLINLESAHICTISSFCLNLIRDYAQESGLNPGFKICEGKEAERFSQQALDFALDALYDGVFFTSDEKNILRRITGEAGDSKLGGAILALHTEYIKQAFPEQWLAEKSALYSENNFADLIKNEQQRIKNDAETCLEYIKECESLSYSDSMTARLCADRTFAEGCLRGEYASDFGNSYYGKASDENKAAKERIKELRDIYIPVFKEIIVTAGLLSDFDFVTARQAPQVQLLSRLFRIYHDKFTALKRENNCIDFADAEHLVLQLLQNNEAAEKIRSDFVEIIVDEFQDSNAVQYEIFKRLSSGGNLFFVGDVKQSIYRFRNADQRVFTQVVEDPHYTTLTLNKNYRSSREVVAVVNEIFGKNMTRGVGGVDYDDSAKLVFGTDNEGSEAELVIIRNADDVKASEANYIAGRIKEMVSGGFEINDKNDGLRACNYGDFAVLVSGLSSVEEEFGAAFEARGVPFDKQKSGDYAEVPEVKIIISLLTIIENPFDDLALLEVLMSPLYNFTADDIAQLRTKGANKPLFDNLESCGFIEDWRRFSAYSRNHGASKLIRLIYSEGAFNPLVAASANPAKTMINIRLLLHYSETLASLTKDTLRGFAEVLRGQSGAALEEARFAGESANRVKLMTIHASKGLEFPVCFVARTNARFNLSENYSDIISSDETGIAMRYIVHETRTRVDTLLHKKAREENKNAAISEEMRKLYVACTRARDKLILTAALKPEREPAKNSYLNWLLQTDLNKNVIESFEAEIIEKEKKVSIVHGNEEDEIIQAVRRVYAREPLTKIPRRVTATQVGVQEIVGGSSVSDELQDEPTVFPRCASFMKNKKLTGKKRGDVYHKIMELINFSAGGFEQQIAELKPRFTEEEFNAVKPEKILRFFASPLGKRACASANVCKEFKLCTEISLTELGFFVDFEEKSFVQGIADMFFYEGESIILTDYKTNRGISAGNLIRQYQKQLEIYARAITEMTGSEVAEKWIFSFELGAIQVI
jgi:ATP-dependent helicase/nuclease subunit A